MHWLDPDRGLHAPYVLVVFVKAFQDMDCDLLCAACVAMPHKASSQQQRGCNSGYCGF